MMKLILAVAAAVAMRMMLAWLLTRHKPGRTRTATTSSAADWRRGTFRRAADGSASPIPGAGPPPGSRVSPRR